MLYVILNRFDSFVEVRICGLDEGGGGIKKLSFDGVDNNRDFLALGRFVMNIVSMTTDKGFNKMPYFKRETSGNYYPDRIIRLEYVEKH